MFSAMGKYGLWRLFTRRGVSGVSGRLEQDCRDVS